MDKVISIAKKCEHYIHYVLAVLFVLHGVNCYSRCDYNVALYIMVYVSYVKQCKLGINDDEKVNKEEKVFTLLLLVGSFVLDIAWFVVYAKKDVVLYGIEWVMWKVCYIFSIVGVVCKVALGVVFGGIAFEKGNVQEMKHLIMN